MELTKDTILNGKIKFLQPKNGYRIAVDTIILSSFIKLKTHQRILDVGCGVGVISLILKMREKQSEITAVDLDEKMCEICRQNAALNSLDINVINASIEHLTLKDTLFDQIVTNPPFFEKEFARVSESKRLAKFETIELSKWVSLCFKQLKSSGTLSMIHRTSRINDILNSLQNIAGAVEIIPIFSKKNHDAKRVVVIAKKSSRSETKILPGIIVHNDNNSYSDYMREILYGNFLESLQ